MKIIITENQHSSLKNNLIDVINRLGFLKQDPSFEKRSYILKKIFRIL